MIGVGLSLGTFASWLLIYGHADDIIQYNNVVLSVKCRTFAASRAIRSAQVRLAHEKMFELY